MDGVNIDIRELRGLDELRECVRLQEEIWGAGFSERVPVAILRVAQRLGGVAAGAFDGGRLVGFVFGLTGIEAGRSVHWSDMLAVRPEARGRGVGERLKRYQRDRLLPLGVRTVYWTFEPLEARNAHFNIARLGVTASEYLENHYGETGSPVHAGIGTDRLLAVWRIADERVRRRLAGAERGLPPEVTRAPVVNPVRGVRDGPVCTDPDLSLTAPWVRIAVPADIQSLRARSPALALEWRARTRAAFRHYFAAGYQVREFARGKEWGAYILTRATAD